MLQHHPFSMPLATFLERSLPALILVVSAVGAPIMIFSAEGLPRLRGLEQELAEVRRDNEEERRKIEFLRKSVERLKADPAAVERIARDELGLVRKNEVVFQFRKLPASLGSARTTADALGVSPSISERQTRQASASRISA